MALVIEASWEVAPCARFHPLRKLKGMLPWSFRLDSLWVSHWDGADPMMRNVPQPGAGEVLCAYHTVVHGVCV